MDGIEFGQVEFREPESELRPDRNRKYCVVGCGQIDHSQLPVFVDLDVMRDMEGHARTNTHVELGGVLLGGKFVDEKGQPFVVVQEALRAEHYEATRGSFKFTHETWAQITRDREQFPDDLHLVGWYHTHPDWGVFLSGMDTFICDNFFNDDLDVDLVIDPCRGDRGWFFWDEVGGARRKQRLDGFYLFTNRYRRTELLQFAQALSEVNPAYFDPRYETPMGETAMQPVVNIHDEKSPVLMVAVLGMLTVQMLVLGLIAWRLLFPPTETTSLAQQQRNEIYRQILGSMAESTPVQTGIVERVESLANENLEMRTNLEGRGLLINQLENDKQRLRLDVKNKKETLDEKSTDLILKETRIEDLKGQLESEKKLNEDIKQGKSIGGMKWPVVAGICLATAIFGMMLGTFIGRRLRDDDDLYDDDHRDKPLSPKPDQPSPHSGESPIPDLQIRDQHDDNPAP